MTITAQLKREAKIWEEIAAHGRAVWELAREKARRTQDAKERTVLVRLADMGASFDRAGRSMSAMKRFEARVRQRRRQRKRDDS